MVEQATLNRQVAGSSPVTDIRKVTMRLLSRDIPKVLGLLKEYNPYMTEEVLKEMTSGKTPSAPCTLIYGIYDGDELASVMVATYQKVAPHEDGKTGRTVQISGAYTKEDKRHCGYATKLLAEIEHDANEYYKADYICCDSSADKLYIGCGFKVSNESRLWKQLVR